MDEAIGNTSAKSVAGKELAVMGNSQMNKVKSDIGNRTIQQTNKIAKMCVFVSCMSE